MIPTEFTISRTFDAPRETLWKAWTDEKKMAQWWSPKGFKHLRATMDLRLGGTYHYGLQAPDGSEFWGKFVFTKITPPQQLVYINSFADEKANVIRHPWSATWPLEMTTTINFEEVGKDKTKFTLQWMPLNAADVEKNTFEEGYASMQAGWTGTLDQLTEYLHRSAKPEAKTA